MDAQSAGAILRILNLVAIADGAVDLQEEELLESLAKQHALQSPLLAWEDKLRAPDHIGDLVALISPEHHQLTLKTAQMVAGVSRRSQDDAYIGPDEQAVLQRLIEALPLTEAAQQQALQEAQQELEQHPNLWQVLFGCFGSQFEWPLLPG